jgi:vanadium chloroperoxidase
MSLMMDSILFWNAVALEAVRVSHSDPGKRAQNGPTLSSRALAIVHLAMYDAYAAVAADPENFPRYLDGLPELPEDEPENDSPSSAVAGAAYSTLSALYAAQQDFFEAQLSCFQTKESYFDFGVKVGKALIELRKNDPDAGDDGYRVSPKRGRHRFDPDNPGQGFHAPFYGAQSKGFAIKERHALDRPPFDRDDGERDKYLAALLQVRAKGIRPDLTATLPPDLFGNRRTAEESLIGIYWAFDGANLLGTPPRLYNQIVRRVAMKVINPATDQINSEGDNARLFAFVNAAMGDAGILAWEQKYCHDLWRPVVGIREHDPSFGPAAQEREDAEGNPVQATNKIDPNADPFWLPFGAPSTNMTDVKNFTPNFPAYPSGHATFGAAAFHITRLFYGVPNGNRDNDNLFEDLAFVSEELNGANRDNTGTVRPRHVRNFPGGLWQMILENAISRVYLGVHWVFDAYGIEGNDVNAPDLTQNVGGVALGLKIAEDIFGTNGRAPKMTRADQAQPLLGMPPAPQQPSSVNNCADEDDQDAEKRETLKSAYPSGLSAR